MNVKKVWGLAAAVLVVASSAQADVIYETPDANLPLGWWWNQANEQNFLARVTLPSTMLVSELDIWTLPGTTAVGTPTTIRIRADAQGQPADSDLYTIASTITFTESSAFYPVVVGSSFKPVRLAAGDWWFGLSGSDSSIAWESSWGPEEPGDQWQLYGPYKQSPMSLGRLAFRLVGTPAQAVPEPASWAMMLIGLGLVGGTMRLRSKHAVRFVTAGLEASIDA
jgi:hypothetical protein